MSYPASLIAYAFVKKGIAEGKPVTQMKLQKMVYFAHGYHLAKYGVPLIEEGFEAWRFGPVVPSIYHTYKLYGSGEIRDADLIATAEFHENNLSSLSPTAWEAINYTWEATKDISAVRLSTWTHKAGSPWAEAFKPNVNSIPISNQKIGEYFTGILFN